MCGRYSLSTDIEGLSFRFDFKAMGLTFQERYNIAPTQQVLTVTNDGSENQAQMMKWGLIPFWAKDPKIGNRILPFDRWNTQLERTARGDGSGHYGSHLEYIVAPHEPL